MAVVPNPMVTKGSGDALPSSEYNALKAMLDNYLSDTGVVTAGFTGASGFSVQTGTQYRKIGPFVMLNLVIQKTGTDLVNAATIGSVSDTNVVTLPAAVWPAGPSPVQEDCTLSTIFGGTCTIDPVTGVVQIMAAAGPASAVVLAVGQNLRLSSLYLAAG